MGQNHVVINGTNSPARGGNPQVEYVPVNSGICPSKIGRLHPILGHSKNLPPTQKVRKVCDCAIFNRVYPYSFIYLLLFSYILYFWEEREDNIESSSRKVKVLFSFSI